MAQQPAYTGARFMLDQTEPLHGAHKVGLGFASGGGLTELHGERLA
jgi:hypothetical protein